MLGVLKLGDAHLSFAARSCNVELLEVCVPQLRLKMPHLAVYLKDALLPTGPQPPKDGGPAPARASASRFSLAAKHRSAVTSIGPPRLRLDSCCAGPVVSCKVCLARAALEALLSEDSSDDVSMDEEDDDNDAAEAAEMAETVAEAEEEAEVEAEVEAEAEAEADCGLRTMDAGESTDTWPELPPASSPWPRM